MPCVRKSIRSLRRLKGEIRGIAALQKRNPCTLHAGKFLIKEGDAMSVLEVLALLGYGLACVKFGYIMGINAKK